MASGKPVVATNIRGCREEVVPGVTGLLVPVRNSQALAEAMVQVLGNPELARRMGQEGRDRAVALFDERLVVDRQLQVYRELVARRAPRRVTGEPVT
jgi:glycosyltransferase involved in cell wall biosynthesis